MSISYFVTAFNRADPTARLDDVQRAALTEVLYKTPRMIGADVCTPAGVETYHKDGVPPLFVLQLDFERLADLEEQLRPGGALYLLAASSLWCFLQVDEVSHQAMYRRDFLGQASDRVDGSLCAYLVHYPGAAADLNVWLGYYLTHHPQIMLDYPGVRRVNVFTRIDWCDAMPWQRVNYMQRNSLAFDSPAALSDALHSPVRARMRADHDCFPPYGGGGVHYAMLVERLSA